MSHKRLLLPMVGLALVTLLLVACATPQPTATTTTMEVTFDGSGCVYDGPESVSAGQVTLIFNNQSEGLALVDFVKLAEGKTWNDILDYLGPLPSSKTRPDWVTGPAPEEVPAGESSSRELSVTGGNYVVVCARSSPLEVWPAGVLMVED